MKNIADNIGSIRSRFPSLSRMESGNRAIYLDGPAGTQVPQSVVDRVAQCMLHHNANRSGQFATSREIDQIMSRCHEVFADFLGANSADSLGELLNDRTRLVAVTAASNAVGSLTPVREIAKRAHAVGAELFVDAVHIAPHRAIDVVDWDCDYLVCSAYKFFGPHIGVLYGRPNRMMELSPYKLRPAPDSLPGRWMTGTQNHACIAGASAAVEYITSLSKIQDDGNNRRLRVLDAMNAISIYETELITRLIAGLASLPNIKLFGITESHRMDERAPTVGFQVKGLESVEVAKFLGDRGVFSWHGNFYALPLTRALGTEPDGMVRLGCMHYNTIDEIDRTLNLIEEIATLP